MRFLGALPRVVQGSPMSPEGATPQQGTTGGSVSPPSAEKSQAGQLFKAGLKLPVFRSSASSAGTLHRANLRVLREVLPNGQQRLLWGEIGPGLATIKAFLATAAAAGSPFPLPPPPPPLPARLFPPPPSPLLGPRPTPRPSGPTTTTIISVESVLAAKKASQDSPSRLQMPPPPAPGQQGGGGASAQGKGAFKAPPPPHLRTLGGTPGASIIGRRSFSKMAQGSDGSGASAGEGSPEGRGSGDWQERGAQSRAEAGAKRMRSDGPLPSTLEAALKHAAMATNKGGGQGGGARPDASATWLPPSSSGAPFGAAALAGNTPRPPVVAAPGVPGSTPGGSPAPPASGTGPGSVSMSPSPLAQPRALQPSVSKPWAVSTGAGHMGGVPAGTGAPGASAYGSSPPRPADGHVASHAHSPATYLHSNPPAAALGHASPQETQAPCHAASG